MGNVLVFQALASRHLNEIADHLAEGMQLALVAYHPSNPEADIVMASGRLEDVRAAIDRRIKVDKPHTEHPADTCIAGNGEVQP